MHTVFILFSIHHHYGNLILVKSQCVCGGGGEVFLELCIIETLVFIQNQVNKS